MLDENEIPIQQLPTSEPASYSIEKQPIRKEYIRLRWGSEEEKNTERQKSENS